MKKIFIHGSGHKASSWSRTTDAMQCRRDVLCPDLSQILHGKAATYANLYASFSDYCGQQDGRLDLCGISLGGILALQYALDHPEKVNTVVLIGTPHKVPKLAFALQNVIFRLLPERTFDNMAFGKKDTFLLGNTMKNIDFTGRLRDVKCPVLILCGKKDGANIKSARFFHENIRGSALKILENAGHVVNEEAPEQLAEILDAFYRETPQTA